jgi:hypothetical protein
MTKSTIYEILESGISRRVFSIYSRLAGRIIQCRWYLRGWIRKYQPSGRTRSIAATVPPVTILHPSRPRPELCRGLRRVPDSVHKTRLQYYGPRSGSSSSGSWRSWVALREDTGGGRPREDSTGPARLSSRQGPGRSHCRSQIV